MTYTQEEKQKALEEKCEDCKAFEKCYFKGEMTSWRRDTQDGIHFTCKKFDKK